MSTVLLLSTILLRLLLISLYAVAKGAHNFTTCGVVFLFFLFYSLLFLLYLYILYILALHGFVIYFG